MEQDSEYVLLSTIKELTVEGDCISQRDLSKAIHMSLGMTNALVRRLTQKGFILIKRVTPRNVTYVLTPDGVNELARRTYRYLKKTMRQVVDYKESILSAVSAAKDRGFTRIGLLGGSDMDFIIEYAAQRAGLRFETYAETAEIPKDTFVFVSESATGTTAALGDSLVHIRDLLGVGV